MSDEQHEGPCCDSCIEDAEYDATYSLHPMCCCQSTWTYEQADAHTKEPTP